MSKFVFHSAPTEIPLYPGMGHSGTVLGGSTFSTFLKNPSTM